MFEFAIDFSILIFDSSLFYINEVMEIRSVKVKSTNRDMVDHVFLHRKLEANPENLQCTELKLLAFLTLQTQSLITPIFPQVVKRLFSNMKQLHCVEALDPEVLSNQIASLKTGDMFGMYIREQNCGLFIQMGENDVATLSTFQASLPNEMIYGHNINGDIQVMPLSVLSEISFFLFIFNFPGWISNALD